MIKGLLLVILYKLHLIVIPVSDIHRGYLRSEITFDGLCSKLRLKQMDEFIAYHEQVKKEFEETSNKGINDLDEMSEEFRDIIEGSPGLRALIESQNGLFLNARDRNRFYCALMQLDNAIEKGLLEQRLMGKSGVNVVRRTG